MQTHPQATAQTLLHSRPPTPISQKIQQYRWSPLDKPGEFCMIKKGEIEVDHSYQREESDARACSMARSFSWVKCGTITVAIRGNKFYAVEGQHRVLAAMKRPDIEELPCMVFESEGAAKEAADFVAINSTRSSIHSHDRFRALLIGGDVAANSIKNTVESFGRTLGKDASQIRCISCIWNLYRDSGPRFKDLFGLVADICENEPITEVILYSVFRCDYLIRESHPTSSILDHQYREPLVVAGSKALTAMIQREVLEHGKGGQGVFARALAKWLNAQNKRKQRYHIKLAGSIQE